MNEVVVLGFDLQRHVAPEFLFDLVDSAEYWLPSLGVFRHLDQQCAANVGPEGKLPDDRDAVNLLRAGLVESVVKLDGLLARGDVGDIIGSGEIKPGFGIG